MALVRWTNLISAWLIIVVALGFLIFLPGDVADYEREPEDVWLGIYWIGVSVLIAALCFANARKARSGALRGARWWLIVCNAVVVAGAIILFIADRLIADGDPALLPLLIPFVLGPAVALAFTSRAHRPST